jgi:hypothetical protein
VELFIQHLPAQGKAALNRLTAELDQQFYPESATDLVVHLSAGPLARPRESLLRNFVLVCLKGLFAPQVPPTEAAALEVSRYRMVLARRESRILATLLALHQLHGQAAVAAIADRLDQLVAAAGDSRLSLAVQLVHAVPDSWHALGPAQQNRLLRFVQKMPGEELHPGLRLAWASAILRPAAEERFAGLMANDWYRLGDAPFPSEWLGIALNRLDESTTWDRSNAIIRSLLKPSITELSIYDIDRVVRAAATNTEIRDAFGFAELLTVAAESPIGSELVVESLRRHDLLENVRDRVSWIDATA